MREDSGPHSDKSADEIVNSAYDITQITKNYYEDIHQTNLNQLLGSKKPSSAINIRGALLGSAWNSWRSQTMLFGIREYFQDGLWRWPCF